MCLFRTVAHGPLPELRNFQALLHEHRERASSDDPDAIPVNLPVEIWGTLRPNNFAVALSIRPDAATNEWVAAESPVTRSNPWNLSETADGRGHWECWGESRWMPPLDWLEAATKKFPHCAFRLNAITQNNGYECFEVDAGRTRLLYYVNGDDQDLLEPSVVARLLVGEPPRLAPPMADD